MRRAYAAGIVRATNKFVFYKQRRFTQDPFCQGVCFRPHPLTTPMRLGASAPRPHLCGFLADDGISHAIYTTSMS